jgi:hypothetical protein
MIYYKKMTNESSTKTPQRSNSKQLEQRLEKLRKSIVGFTVENQQGEFIGVVQDLVIDPTQHLNFVLTRSSSDPVQKSFLLKSNLVDHVNPKSHIVSIHLSSSEIANLSVYPMQSDAMRSDPIEPTYSQSSRHSVADLQSIEPSGELTLEHTPETGSTETQVERSTASELTAPKAIEANAAESKALEQDIIQEESIRLLEERLVVHYQKQKVGEVIVRKEIETRMVQVPVRREKLIVEQVGSAPRKLAEIDLTHGEIEGLEFSDSALPSEKDVISNPLTLQGEFSSPRTAAWLLDAIAHQSNHGCKRIRIEIELDDPHHKDLYQEWFDRCRDSNRA